jgi:hypothetical protein
MMTQFVVERIINNTTLPVTANSTWSTATSYLKLFTVGDKQQDLTWTEHRNEATLFTQGEAVALALVLLVDHAQRANPRVRIGYWAVTA